MMFGLDFRVFLVVFSKNKSESGIGKFKKLHSFSLGNLLSLKGDNIFGRETDPQGPQVYSNAVFSGETKGFSKENKRRNPKKDHMWLLGISHLLQIRRHLFQADDSELARSDHMAPFLHKKRLLFL